jgi:Tol biopolymer transport system component
MQRHFLRGLKDAITSNRFTKVFVILSVTFAFAFATALHAQPVKISGPLVAGGDVQSSIVTSTIVTSADGRYVVFIADKDQDGRNELYSVQLGSGVVQNISGGGFPAGGNVISFQISPDSSRVVFYGNLVSPGTIELFSAPIGGGSRITLSGNVVTGGNVSGNYLQISPDSTRVVFTGDLMTDEVTELFSAPITTANARLTLSGNVSLAGDAFLRKISPDSSHVVFMVYPRSVSGNRRIFSTPIGGGTPASLIGNAASGSSVGLIFEISPNSSRVVFTGDLVTVGVRELFSAPIGGGSPITLSGNVVAGGNVFESSFQISPDSTRVVFEGDLITNGTDELFSAPIASANSRIALSGTVIPGASLAIAFWENDLGPFQITPDGTRVVFYGALATAGIKELYSAPIATANARVTLSANTVAGGEIGFIRFTPDSARVIFTGDLVTDQRYELFSVPIATANARVSLSGSVVQGGGIKGDFRISPDGSRAVFKGDLVTVGKQELFSSPLVGGTRVTLSGGIVGSGNLGAAISSFEISADSSRVVFRGDLVVDEQFELYSAPIAISNARTTLSAQLAPGGDVDSAFLVSKDGGRVIFRADKDVDEQFELYRVQIGGAALSLDFDGDDIVLPTTDGLMLTRFLLGLRGTAITSGALGVNATITAANLIESRIRAALAKPL